jgi:hypothetical protein
MRNEGLRRRKQTAGCGFVQSLSDFPLRVSLGKRGPSWELRRWGGELLRFHPLAEDRFTVRGDRRTLEYRGGKENHRFTILDGQRFEYDIILNREPETNRIYVLLDGWERFDFFKQPLSIADPLLAGSYAVYKKDTVNTRRYSMGTGKLCHIHRPKILDARGREIWGAITIHQGIMTISIPEAWLSEAAYPVVVDPVIGCTTAGAQYSKYFMTADEYADFLDYAADEGLSASERQEELRTYTAIITKLAKVIVNKYTTQTALQGKYKAYYYAGWLGSSSNACVAPVLLSHSGNLPCQLRSGEEYGLRTSRTVTSPGWKNTTFTVPNTIAANTPVWFGLFSHETGVNFDYGAECFDICYGSPSLIYQNIQNGVTAHNRLTGIDTTMADYRNNAQNTAYIEEAREIPAWKRLNAHPLADSRYDFKLSVYFQEYSVAYARTITQGVTLSDSRKRTHNAKRILAQAVTLQHTGKRIQRVIRIMALWTAAVSAILLIHVPVRFTLSWTPRPSWKYRR